MLEDSGSKWSKRAYVAALIRRPLNDRLETVRVARIFELLRHESHFAARCSSDWRPHHTLTLLVRQSKHALDRVRLGSALRVIRGKRASHCKVVIRRDKLAGLDARLECIQVGAMPSTACSIEVLDEIVARAQPLIVAAVAVREEGRERYKFLLCSSTICWRMQIDCIQSNRTTQCGRNNML